MITDFVVVINYIRDVFTSIMNIIFLFPVFSVIGILFILDWYLSRDKNDGGNKK